MKRLLGLRVLVCGTLMPLSPALAQENKPDFSGVWVLDEQTTDLSDKAAQWIKMGQVLETEW